MPECHRCGRMQATAELRRSSLGYVCKDNGPGTRCHTLTRELRMREHNTRTREQTDSAQLRIDGAA